MTIKDLSYFLQVCEAGSINGAARNLYISTQDLCRILKNIEDELGYPIFERTKTGVTLTDDGRILERHAREILAQSDALTEEIRRRHSALDGRLRIAAAYGLISLFGPASILAFRRQNPDIHVEISEYTDLRVAEAVWYREADWGLVNLPVDESRYHAEPLADIPLYLLVNCDTPLSRLDTVDITQLQGQPIAIQNQEFSLHQLILRKCRQAGFEPQVVFETNGVCMCNQLYLQNETVSVVPAHTMRNLRSDRTRLIPFADREMQLQCALIRRADGAATREMEHFLSFLSSWKRPAAL